MAASAVPDASASRHPRPPHAARPPVGHDDHVADVARVAEPPLEQPAVEHDAAAHAGRHHHGDVVGAAGGGADPTLTQGERLGVVVDEGRQPGQLGQAGAQGEGPPRGDVQRRHLLTAGAHRPAAPRAADDDGGPPRRTAGGDALHQLRPGRPRGPRRHSRPPCPAASGSGRIARSTRDPSPVDQPGRHLGAADVDGQCEVCHGNAQLGPDPDCTVEDRGSAGPRDGPARCSALAPVEAGAEPVAAPRSPRPRSRSTPRPISTPRPSTASGRASRPGPCGAGCARTTRRRRT